MSSHVNDEPLEVQEARLRADLVRSRGDHHDKLKADLSNIGGVLTVLTVMTFACLACVGMCYNSIENIHAKMDKSVATMSTAFAQHIATVGVSGFAPIIEKSLKRALASMVNDASTNEGSRFYEAFRRHGCDDFGIHVVNTTKRIEIKFFCDPIFTPVDELGVVMM